MSIRYQIIMLLNSTAIGLMLPILSLAILEKGASPGQLALFMGIYSFTVLLTELPTGIFADLFGRKLTFLLSPCFSAAYAIVFLLSSNIVAIAAAMVLLGLSRSFASGSMEALLMDRYIELHGEEGIARISMQLSILEAVGLAAGALLGGALPGLSAGIFHSGGAYRMNFIGRIFLSALLVILVQSGVKEVYRESTKALGIMKHEL